MSRKSITVELEPNELAALARYAKAEKRTKAAAARRLIVLALDSEYFANTELARGANGQVKVRVTKAPR